ncbi:hypothetical protein WICPIJ_006562 [Wickerhamomyces pijperi]|uniref:Uncharacterized protein n=1 Tax=Wickerhamomyces pijperi TaxID=599730 RepID=A0A9P8Q471_WICPI|nr:hypothetical protein WICPIJ_006562 [Wickerhamomyces pijperi]
MYLCMVSGRVALEIELESSKEAALVFLVSPFGEVVLAEFSVRRANRSLELASSETCLLIGDVAKVLVNGEILWIELEALSGVNSLESITGLLRCACVLWDQFRLKLIESYLGLFTCNSVH